MRVEAGKSVPAIAGEMDSAPTGLLYCPCGHFGCPTGHGAPPLDPACLNLLAAVCVDNPFRTRLYNPLQYGSFFHGYSTAVCSYFYYVYSLSILLDSFFSFFRQLRPYGFPV